MKPYQRCLMQIGGLSLLTPAIMCSVARARPSPQRATTSPPPVAVFALNSPAHTAVPASHASAMPANASEAAESSLANQLKVLATAGCDRIAESSSADDEELQCNGDPSFFLCSQMQAREARLNCAIDTQASKIDWSHQEATALIASPEFAKAVKAEPCVAWVYPEEGGAKREYGVRCAANILQSLHCVVGAPEIPTAVCPSSALVACSALLESGYVRSCALKTGAKTMPTVR